MILFREYQKRHTELKLQKSSKIILLIDFLKEIILNKMGFNEYVNSPVYRTVNEASFFYLNTSLSFLI